MQFDIHCSPTVGNYQPLSQGAPKFTERLSSSTSNRDGYNQMEMKLKSIDIMNVLEDCSKNMLKVHVYTRHLPLSQYKHCWSLEWLIIATSQYNI